MRRKSLFATFALAISLLATGCGAGGSSSNNLELIYFGKYREEQTENINYKYQLPKRSNEEPDDQYYYLENYGDNGVVLDAVIKNNDRLSFLDIVLYSASTGKKYVYTAGVGDYVVEASTELNNDVWTTRLRFQWIGWDIYGKESDKCFFDTYLEIEEINFLTLSGAVTRTNIANSNIKRVNVHVVEGREEYHNWTQWKTIERSCENYAGRYRNCPDCGREQEELDWEQPPYGHDCDDWTLENKTPGILQQGDIFSGVGNCKRCNKPASCVLPKLSIDNFSLTIPSDITTIGKEAFYDSFGLVSVTIPSTVTTIGARAFGYCHDLKTVIFESSNPPKIGGDLFAGTWDSEEFKIYVPCGCGDAYKAVQADYWRECATGHIIDSHRYGEWVLNNDTNTYERVCSVCGKKQTRSSPIGSVTNSDGKVVTFTYEDNGLGCYYESIKITDGTFISGGIQSSGKMDNGTDIKWRLPVFDYGEVNIQLSIKMSQESHNTQIFDPSLYIIKVNGIERPSLFPTDNTYFDLGLTTEVQYFSFAKYEITSSDVSSGEIEVEFIHQVPSYRLLFSEDLRLLYS